MEPLPTDEYYDLLAAIQRTRNCCQMSRQAFSRDRPEPVHVEGFGLLRLIDLREPDGSRFPFLQGLAKPDLSDEKR